MIISIEFRNGLTIKCDHKVVLNAWSSNIFNLIRDLDTFYMNCDKCKDERFSHFKTNGFICHKELSRGDFYEKGYEAGLNKSSGKETFEFLLDKSETVNSAFMCGYIEGLKDSKNKEE